MPTHSAAGSMLSVLDLSTKSSIFTNQYTQSVHDALWALSSQYMMGQFKGEDTGSILYTRVYYDSYRLNRFESNNNSIAIEENIPMDVLIERQEIKFDLGMEIQLGNYWKKLLKKAEFDEDVVNTLNKFEIHKATTDEEVTNITESELRNSLSGKCINGGLLLNFIIENLPVNDANSALTSEIESTNTLSPLIEDFLNYAQDLYGLDYFPNNSWDKSRLEYSAKSSYPLNSTGTEQQALLAEEYDGKGIDWYSFDRSNVSADKIEGVTVDDENDIKSESFEIIPNPVTFKSMPTDRWWQIHDSNTNLLKWNNDRNDLIGTLMKDFAITFNHDWSQFPFVVETGKAFEITHVVAKDVFGDFHYVGGVHDSNYSSEGEEWDVFKMNKKGDLEKSNNHFYYPQRVLPIEGEIIEKVSFQRDEMANLCWAIELRISDNIGGFQDADAASNRFLQHCANKYYSNELIGHSEDLYEFPDSNATTHDILRYLLLNPTPENWIPFVPKNLNETNSELSFQRATFKRLIKRMEVKEEFKDNPEYDEFVRPRTSLLRHGLDLAEQEPYFIKEEEIPRIGVVVSRRFKRARWHDGSTHIWLSNQKQVGRGDINSKLNYDSVEKKYTEEFRTKIIDEYVEPEYVSNRYTE